MNLKSVFLKKTLLLLCCAAIMMCCTACMTAGVEDFRALNLPCDGICYLGYAVEGSRLEFLY